jgi:hypothetical protein
MTEDEVCYLVAWGAFALGALCINGALLWGACMAVQALIAGEPGAVAGLAMIGGVFVIEGLILASRGELL